MTVAELIAELQKLPQDMLVVDRDSEWGLSLVRGAKISTKGSYGTPAPVHVELEIEGKDWP